MEDPENQPESLKGKEVQPRTTPKGNGSVEVKVNKKKSKRTKSGCLTCRRRRVKCGEEKPVCTNCIKSKRQCEGYNQRVVFKDPLSAYHGPPFSGSSTISFVPQSRPVVSKTHSHRLPQTSSGPLLIAPKPSEVTTVTPVDHSHLPAEKASSQAVNAEQASYHQHQYSYRRRSNTDLVAQSAFQYDSDTVHHSHVPFSDDRQTASTHYSHGSLNLSQTPLQTEHPFIAAEQTSDTFRSIRPDQSFISSSEVRNPHHTNPPNFHSSNSAVSKENDHYHQQSFASTALASLPSPPETATSQDTGSQTGQRSSVEPVQANHLTETGNLQDYEHAYSASYGRRPSMHIEHYPIEDDDDLYDVSDEDEDMLDDATQIALQDHMLKSNNLGIFVALQARQDMQEAAARSYTSFINRANMLATYQPSARSSPLDDPMTARIFCHFINVTGPSISLFERSSVDPSLVFQGRPVPKSQQHIWSYTFPILALKNPALLHAMLAIASLHIAKLQDGPVTASLKHCAIALRRIAKIVGIPSRRRQPATLAATMLLGFYEIWCSDHQKWTNHLLGARQLVKEIDFVGMTRSIKKRRNQQYQDYAPNHDVDEDFVGMLTGKRFRQDQHGQTIAEDVPAVDDDKKYTDAELDMYETQQDLFWWYCKQDVYQSILGGGTLFMSYDRWSDCPPRSPIGRLNASYGTFDHLMLLMGRLANFASKDIKRKKKVIAMNGGWRPPEASAPPPPASSGPPGQGFPPYSQSGSTAKPNAPPSAPPPILPFAGMMPETYVPKLPMGFTYSGDGSPQSSKSDESDLETQTAEAEEEWGEIRKAFAILEDNFGQDFQALGPENLMPIQTPFGSALHYRTFAIATIWQNYYMGLIACYRAHPSMPPAAMMASGIAARQTALFANEVGRIAAGIAPFCDDPSVTQVTTDVGAAIIESSMPLFIAGVQYQDAAQRAWTISRLRAITRLTGWQTAEAILLGCETSWFKIGEMGRGPPYVRTKDLKQVTRVFADSSRRIDRAIAEADGVEGDGRLVVARTDRPHYALGVLAFETDFEHLDLGDDLS